MKKTIKHIVKELIENKEFKQAKDLLSTYAPSDIAEILENVDVKDIAYIFRLVPKDKAAEVFSYLPISMETELLTCLSDKEAVDILNEMFADDVADVLDEMPANVVTRLLKKCDVETRQTINKLLNYPEESAGSVMTVEFCNLKEDLTVKQAVSQLRRDIDEYETINTCYVVDHERKLIGYITMKDILLADPEDLIGDIARLDTVCVKTSTDQEDVAKLFKKYDITVLPVVDLEERLVGIITVDDVLDIMEAEASEDIEKMAAITPTDKPYLKVSVWETWKSRIPWLIILIITSTFTSSIINGFEEKLTAVAILTAYIPMLMGSGGNSGSQAAVTIIRGLSLNEIDFKDTFKVILKELKVSIIAGITLAIATFLKLYLLDYLILGYNFGTMAMQAMLVVSVSILFITVMAKFLGCTLPIIVKKVGLDPAVVASPIITTIIDALGLIIYFKIAQVMLLNLL